MTDDNTVEESSIGRDDLPALYLAASKASKNAQKRYLRLVIFNLILIISATLLSSFDFPKEPINFYISCLSAVLLVGSMLITLLIFLIKLEKNWYGGRAIAESVKTLSWRYLTGATPYEINLSASRVDSIFSDDLKAVLDEKKFLSGALGGKLSTQPQISDKMRWARTLGPNLRKDLYVNFRIKPQQNWYADNSESNKHKELYSFSAIIIFELLALIGLILIIKFTNSVFNPVGLFTTLAVSTLAWLQLKQYQELSQSYGLATQELGLIFIESKSVKNNKQLSDFVLNSENAISREHTMWIARKENI